MIDKIKEKYKKNHPIMEIIPDTSEMFNTLFKSEKQMVDEKIEILNQEYQKRMKELNTKKSEVYRYYEEIAVRTINLSTFKMEYIAPILAEIISLYEGQEYKYRNCIKSKFNVAHYFYSGIQLASEYFYNLPFSEMLLDESEYRYNDTIQFFSYKIKNDCNLEMYKHSIFERCPYLLNFVEMLIINEIINLPENEQIPAMKKIEAEFIYKNLDEIKKHHAEIYAKEEIEYQSKLEKNKEIRDNLLSKTLKKINEQNELAK